MNDDKLVEELLKRRQFQYEKYISPLDATIMSLGGKLPMYIPPPGNAPVAQSNGNGHSQQEKYSEVIKASTIKDKLIAILRIENKFLHVRQFAEILHNLDPKLSEDDWRGKSSPLLSSLKRESNGKIVTVVVNQSNTNNFWGSKAWLGNDGFPKKEHMYDESYILTGTKAKEIEI